MTARSDFGTIPFVLRANDSGWIEGIKKIMKWRVRMYFIVP